MADGGGSPGATGSGSARGSRDPGPAASSPPGCRAALEVEALALRVEALIAGQPQQVWEWATDRGRLHRFLQGHSGNMDRALATLRWCLDQRLQLQLWRVDLEEVRAELELGKVYCRSLDRDLHPVVLYRNCRADHTLELAMRLRALVLVLDGLEASLDRGDFNGCSTWVVILDFGGKPARGSMTFDYLSRLIKLFMKSYPGRLHRCFVVDANMLMNAFWSAACKILEADTIRKVRFVRRSWDSEGRCHVPELMEQIGVDHLEEEYGGHDDFKWDPVRHWRVLNLMPTCRSQLPLLEAARLAAMEAGSACASCSGQGCTDCDGAGAPAGPGGQAADSRSCGGDSAGSGGRSALGGSEARWFDAVSEGPSVPPLDWILNDCRTLHKQLGEGYPAAEHDPRVLRLRSDLARFLQEWEAGVGVAEEEDWRHCSGAHGYPTGEQDPLKPSHISIQDSPSGVSTAASVAAASAASALAAASDSRLKALLFTSGTTLLLVVIMLGLLLVKLF